MVNRFPVHHRESKRPRLLSVSDSDKQTKHKNNKTAQRLQILMFNSKIQWQHRNGGRAVTLRSLQKLAVWLSSRVKPPLSFLSADFTMIPGHLLMGGCSDQLLKLRGLTDDGLLHGLSLNKCRNMKSWYVDYYGILQQTELFYIA